MAQVIPNVVEFVSTLNPITLFSTAFLSGGLIGWIRWKRSKEINLIKKLRSQRLVVITGCDSGLGLAMAFWAAKCGYKVLAGCYNSKSDGACFLRSEFSVDDLIIQEVDVTKNESLLDFKKCCEVLLYNNQIHLWALIPNAAVGSFGEFFWMTENQGRKMMDVNFWGSVNLTQVFHPLLLKFKSRLIVITSDCADVPLPGLSVYSATKAALENWACALRLEVAKFGISVTCFQPGNFPTQTRLFSTQQQAYEEMKLEMKPEDAEFYGKYFHDFNEALIGFFNATPSKKLQEDDEFQRDFLILLENDMRYIPVVTRNPFILHLFHFFFRHLPTRASDWLKLYLMRPPLWIPKPYPTIDPDALIINGS